MTRDASTQWNIVEGVRVRLLHDVDRYPHFIARKGMTGTVTQADEWTICVRMDDHLNGAEEWSNEIVWTDADDITEDVEVIQ